ncbi:hypothetical protein HHI36_000464 [Cryptolaemus montrouzieri]|uniref:Sulfotransferase domain-containing protein n=1 Tax=Cryptolaemus montrouzieri TaxID=559131 RepID=A0ABD2P4Q8_9CUCU
MAQQIIDFEVRPDDIWIMGIPRSGTTILQELTWLLRNDLDYEGAKTNLIFRVPFLSKHYLVFNEKAIEERLKMNPGDEKFLNKIGSIIKDLEEKKGKRTIKTHLPFDLLPPDIMNKGCKVIYVCRNPKDVAFSYYTLQSKLWQINYVGDFLNIGTSIKTATVSILPCN